MCGIAGFITPPGQTADPELLRRMAQTMILRGPDGEGIYTDGSVGFAHRRLSVIDLEGGAQPMSSADGSLVVVFNGEIFNFLELRKELEDRGMTFRTRSDTEVLLAMYETFGSDFVKRLDGFFAFALYDRRRRIILLGRDRLGVKPLYYGIWKGFFAFASEIASLRCLPFAELDRNSVDPVMAAHFFCYQYVAPEKSIYKNLWKLPPASIGIVHLQEEGGTTDGKGDALVIQRYWSLDYSEKIHVSYEDACGELERRMRRAVSQRMISDVPLGVSLSGGLDSCIVAGLAAELSEKTLECFSIGFPVPEYDESCAARIAAEHLKKSFAVHGLNHHVKMADPSDFSLLEFLSVRFGEPYADASMLPTLLLSRFSREFVTVALSGDGADEFFGGYERYIAMNCMRKIRPVPKSLLKAASALLPSGGERSRMGRLKRFLVCASEDPQKQYESIVTHRGRSVLQLFASPELRNAAEQLDKGFDCSEENLCCLHTAQDIAEFCMEEDVHNYLPGDILVKTDTCSMAASLELRSPFLDHHVAEFAASLPVEWKLEGKKRKRILMDAFRKYLPCDPEKIRKRGFGVPLALWFRTCWNAKMKEHLLDPSFADGVFVERSGIERMIKDHEQGRADYSPMIFSLLMFSFFEKNQKS